MAKEQLNCYASGDGALHFTWIKGTIATGRHTTLDDVKKWMRTTEDGQRYTKQGWMPMVLNGNPIIVSHVERVSANVLRTNAYEGDQVRDYTYEVLPEYKEWEAKKMLNISSIKVTTEYRGNSVVVENWSTKGRLAHFLNHEAEIVAWAEAERFQRVFNPKGRTSVEDMLRQIENLEKYSDDTLNAYSDKLADLCKQVTDLCTYIAGEEIDEVSEAIQAESDAWTLSELDEKMAAQAEAAAGDRDIDDIRPSERFV